MVNGLGEAETRRWVETFLEAASRDADALGELDRASGDGDFGTNLMTSVRAATAGLAGAAVVTPAAVFAVLSTSFMASGGTSGPLFGMWFRELATAAGDAPTVGTVELAAGVAAGLATVQRLGGAAVGDKTMVDAISPAAAALAVAAEDGVEPTVALASAAGAARGAADRTSSLVARRGCASYVGEHARGIVDPGAATVALFFESAPRG